MRTFYVVMEDHDVPYDPLHRFICQADDAEHAEEQANNAYPDDEIVWIDDDESLKESDYAYFWE